MMSRLLVLGAGELGTACALSLVANMEKRDPQARAVVTMCARDREYLHELQFGSQTFRMFDRNIRVPSEMSFQVMGEEPVKKAAYCEASFLCIPVSCFMEEKSSTPREETTAGLRECLIRHANAPLFVFCRGFSREGLTPVEAINRVICPQPSKVAVVSGPLFAKEWAAASVLENNVTSSSHTTNSNSGVSLAFAMADGTDAETIQAMRNLSQRLWQREGVTWLTEPNAAGILSFINGCFPLCCMGAGMVSSEYPASVSAMMSYMQHAISATEQLVNQAFSRPQGTPLPACAVATLAMACTNHASREFVFGRHLNYHFRHRDAIRAVFPGNSCELLDATVAGIHTLLKRLSFSSPFYEVLMDAFLTVLRASVAGRGLVKSGCYDYRDHVCMEDAPLLQHALAVDDAMLSGDEEGFNKACQTLAMVFSSPVAPPSKL
ncbi:oxidoreductase (with NAD(+) or NADP(+) as acceptor) [Trypanosoma rangeli]|uniref:Oxidoreductase (With NAD(+) or NADP(+) as acceptor) n=1 Tax=Trypanosoma rangeli TaxID=5698 RepID=A0A422NEK6_TRYRA|nr:oxidoreductase (with NAD(+) or NADP(+) as acceptor) [Trypanosoma rangeli]RNF03891.1 oxidoreductase (with NAD(+) or NADP(+) as acceptor) [Trypanosoma rangeli]|eukprot:RNF03891.1 oxidoreductase (with NAD(+) or NADP(+) as acceptor) [Trypanosoma rangeli]